MRGAACARPGLFASGRLAYVRGFVWPRRCECAAPCACECALRADARARVRRCHARAKSCPVANRRGGWSQVSTLAGVGTT
jgi:hypothetical protein